MKREKNSNIFIVIAAFNEGKKILSVVKSLQKEGYDKIVVVDDGSSDQTFDVVSKMNIFALRHKKNRGQGAALRTGICFALKRGADIIVTFDADGQHKASEVKRLVNPIVNKQADVVLGSRFLGKHEKMVLIIRFLLWCGILLHLALYGVWLTDVHNGFRALSRNAAKKIKITQDRMEHASEIIEQIVRKKISFVEVPVTIVYTKYSVGHGQTPWQRVKVGFNLLWKKVFG